MKSVFGITKRIMKSNENDLELKKDLQEIINNKTKLYYTLEDFSSNPINPFEYKQKDFKI